MCFSGGGGGGGVAVKPQEGANVGSTGNEKDNYGSMGENRRSGVTSATAMRQNQSLLATRAEEERAISLGGA